jgi:serine/threonine protein kinase
VAQPDRAFEVLEIPASGAYGTVCVARLVGDGSNRLVALKVLRTHHMDRPRVMARTRDEARLLMRLAHPNIVRVEQLLQLAGRPVLVMEWVEGVSLSRLLASFPDGVPWAVAVEITRQAAVGLDYAWDGATAPDGRPLRIVHRDIKPGNVLLSVTGEVKVVDFGIARSDSEDREITHTNTNILGSQGYIAPERLSGVPDTSEVDVYALGVTLYELLTRRAMLLPLQAQPHAVALPGYIAQLAPDAPPEVVAALRDIIARACATDRDHRPSLASLAADLGALVVHPPDLAAFAAEHVRPLHEGRPRGKPASHPDYSDLAFLEQTWDVMTASPQGEFDPAADRAVRQFLAKQGWELQTSELYWLLATESMWTEAPFLEVVDRARRRWWRFWEAPAPPAQVAVALRVLRHRRSKEVLERAKALIGHPDRGVAAAAAAVISGV